MPSAQLEPLLHTLDHRAGGQRTAVGPKGLKGKPEWADVYCPGTSMGISTPVWGPIATRGTSATTAGSAKIQRRAIAIAIAKKLNLDHNLAAAGLHFTTSSPKRAAGGE